MKKTTTIATAVLLFAGLAPAAWASHPSRHEMRKVKHLAHELSEGARYLYEKSAAYERYPDHRAKTALYDLHELAQASHHFYSQTGRYYNDPYHTEADFRALINAYYRASDSFQYLSTYHHYRRDFRCLTDYMDSLVYYYGGYDTYSRHDRRGHDRPGYYEPGHRRYNDRDRIRRHLDTAGRVIHILDHVLDDHP